MYSIVIFIYYTFVQGCHYIKKDVNDTWSLVTILFFVNFGHIANIMAPINMSVLAMLSYSTTDVYVCVYICMIIFLNC